MKPLIAIGVMLFVCSVVTAGIAPSKLEVNLGPMPIDAYLLANNSNSSNCAVGPVIPPNTPQCIVASFPSCPPSSVIQSCFRAILQAYSAQGVTGIRFQFGLGGGGYSTAFTASGGVNQTWLSNLSAFFADIHSYGIANITPTPVMTEGWSGALTSINVNTSPSCSLPHNVTLWFFPWLPYGLDQNQWPADMWNNNSYACSPANPIFWGWSNNFALFGAVLNTASSNGLNVGEFDLQNEVNLVQFPVQARLIIDNTTRTAVLGQMQSMLAAKGYNPGAATVSTLAPSPAVAGDTCLSVFDRPAQFLDLDEVRAVASESYFGAPPNPQWKGQLWCGTPGDYTGMVLPPTYDFYSPPTVLDVHATPSCYNVVNGQCDESSQNLGTVEAKQFFSDFWNFTLSVAGSPAAAQAYTPMFGELPNNQPGACDAQTSLDATATVSGYLQSTLYANLGSRSVLRPWENSVAVCYQIPASIGAPSGPYTR